MEADRKDLGHDARWEGPASAVVRGALIFPGHLSLWTRDGAWGGRLVLDVFAPLDDEREIELALRDAGRFPIAIHEVSRQPGIQAQTATVILFTGYGVPPSAVSGGLPSPFDL